MRKLEKELKQVQAKLQESREHVTRLEANLLNERNSLALAKERNDRHADDIRAPTVSKAITAAKQVAREMGHARPEIDSVRLKGTIDAEVAK